MSFLITYNMYTKGWLEKCRNKSVTWPVHVWLVTFKQGYCKTPYFTHKKTFPFQKMVHVGLQIDTIEVRFQKMNSMDIRSFSNEFFTPTHIAKLLKIWPVLFHSIQVFPNEECAAKSSRKKFFSQSLNLQIFFTIKKIWKILSSCKRKFYVKENLGRFWTLEKKLFMSKNFFQNFKMIHLPFLLTVFNQFLFFIFLEFFFSFSPCPSYTFKLLFSISQLKL